MIRYGCQWPDGSDTGAISDSYRLAAAYARTERGTVLDYQEDGTSKPHQIEEAEHADACD